MYRRAIFGSSPNEQYWIAWYDGSIRAKGRQQITKHQYDEIINAENPYQKATEITNIPQGMDYANMYTFVANEYWYQFMDIPIGSNGVYFETNVCT